MDPKVPKADSPKMATQVNIPFQTVKSALRAKQGVVDTTERSEITSPQQ